MKTFAISSLLCFTATWAQAQEVGQVISRTAVYQQVAVPRQTCTQTAPQPPTTTSGGGAIIGAIAGGLIGSQLGGRDSQGIATMAGVIGGAVLGNKVEGQGNPPTPQTTCTTQTVYENRLIGYNVVYEYAGKQYTVQLPQDPGPTIPLQVTPMSAPRSEAPTGTIVSAVPPVTVVNESHVVYVPTPVYRSYPPVYTNLNLGWGWSSGYGHRYSHGHWR
jgi:uncharacterized protein YcfJ